MKEKHSSLPVLTMEGENVTRSLAIGKALLKGHPELLAGSNAEEAEKWSKWAEEKVHPAASAVVYLLTGQWREGNDTDKIYGSALKELKEHL